MKNRFLVALALFSLIAAGCDRGNNDLGGSGFIEATSVVVSAETAGRLDRLFVDEGDAVSRGAVLGVIDSSMTILQLDRALAQRLAAATAIDIARITIEQAVEDAQLAHKEFERIASLIEKGSANQQQYDQAQTRDKQAGLAKEHAQASYRARQADLERIDAEIALLRRSLEDCSPTAPVTGVVVNKLTEAGELLAPGKPIVEIAKIDTVWVKIYLPAHGIAAIQLGETVTVDPEDGRTELSQGKVVWISDQAEFTPKNVQTAEARADLVYAVKVNIANPGGVFKIGMPVMVRFSK
jgi:HlyD family secretion protein